MMLSLGSSTAMESQGHMVLAKLQTHGELWHSQGWSCRVRGNQSRAPASAGTWAVPSRLRPASVPRASHWYEQSHNPHPSCWRGLPRLFHLAWAGAISTHALHAPWMVTKELARTVPMDRWNGASRSCRQLGICPQRLSPGESWDVFPTWKMEVILTPQFLAEAEPLPVFQHISPGWGSPVPYPSSLRWRESQVPAPCQLSFGTIYCCCPMPGRTRSATSHGQICPQTRRAISILKTLARILQTRHMVAP